LGTAIATIPVVTAIARVAAVAAIAAILNVAPVTPVLMRGKTINVPARQVESRGVNGNILRALTRTGRFVCFFALALTLFAGLRSGILRGARAGYPADHL
jgi:hypothetical protein